MRLGAIAVVSGLLGCDRLFDVREFQHVDAAAIPFDATYCRANTTNAIVDTYLADEVVRGSNDAMLITAEHPGLFHFQSGVMAGERIAGAIVTLRPVATAMECGVGCGACNNPKGPVGWHVWWNTNSWDEKGSTAHFRLPPIPWGMDFAAADNTDRTLEVERGTTDVGDPIQLVLEPANVVQTAPLSSPVDQGRVTVQVRFDSQVAVSSRELSDCPNHNTPTMTFVLCRTP